MDLWLGTIIGSTGGPTDAAVVGTHLASGVPSAAASSATGPGLFGWSLQHLSMARTASADPSRVGLDSIFSQFTAAGSLPTLADSHQSSCDRQQQHGFLLPPQVARLPSVGFPSEALPSVRALEEFSLDVMSGSAVPARPSDDFSPLIDDPTSEKLFGAHSSCPSGLTLSDIDQLESALRKRSLASLMSLDELEALAFDDDETSALASRFHNPPTSSSDDDDSAETPRFFQPASSVSNLSTAYGSPAESDSDSSHQSPVRRQPSAALVLDFAAAAIAVPQSPSTGSSPTCKKLPKRGKDCIKKAVASAVAAAAVTLASATVQPSAQPLSTEGDEDDSLSPAALADRTKKRRKAASPEPADSETDPTAAVMPSDTATLVASKKEEFTLVDLATKLQLNCRFRDCRRSLLENQKMTPEQLEVIASSVESAALVNYTSTNATRKMSLERFCKLVLVMVFHFGVRDGRLPSFWKRMDHHLLRSVLMDSDAETFQTWHPDVGMAAHALMQKQSLSVAQAIARSQADIRSVA